MARKIVAANWKENPKSSAAAMRLFAATARTAGKERATEVVICPPPIFLEDIARAFSKKHPANLALGAQDVFWEEKGPFTGGVGPKMLRALGVRYVIVGHSERRKWFNETDAMINKKVLRAAADGLRVILCVGEPAEVRKKGIAAAKRYLRAQLAYDLKKVFGEGFTRSIIVAYEPIWAIGSGVNDDPKDAAAIASFIKGTVRAMGGRAKVLYGGSVNGRNIRGYVQLKEIDGALVGGASLKAEGFGKLIINSGKK
ncbi:MAG: triose-phosphate isomerase [Candidatus Pacebacteria bacterium]|nr:triose-phosphate isomerase [Candidatus Paceibacterota bacterium]